MGRCTGFHSLGESSALREHVLNQDCAGLLPFHIGCSDDSGTVGPHGWAKHRGMVDAEVDLGPDADCDRL